MPRFSANSAQLGRQNNLFELPLPLPEDSIYLELNLDPSATAEEVGWAVKVLNGERTAEKLRLYDKIKATACKVAGLQAAYEELENVQGSGKTDERGLQRMAELENRALDIDPGFQEKRRKAKELEEKINALNAMQLGMLSGLSKYDESHPPFGLMKLAPATRDEFFDQSRTELWILRREITRFLKEKGEAIAYANDLDREDFSADFCWNPILDGGK
jgi:hypothetical protein